MIYTIKAGKHYSTSWLGMVWRFFTGWQTSNTAQYSVAFDDSCLGATHDPNDADDEGKDINKLFGLAEEFDHHENSARFGWKEIEGKIGLYTYVYKDGVRQKPGLLYKMDVREFIDLGIWHSGGKWFFCLQRNKKIISTHQVSAPEKEALFYRKLYPYIGGDYTAKQDVKIVMSELASFVVLTGGYLWL